MGMALSTKPYAVNADDLLKMTTAQLSKLPELYWDVTFHNGEVLHTTKRRTMYSHMYWRLHALYPGAIVRPTHHVGNGKMRQGMELDLMEVIFWDVWRDHVAHAHVDKYELVWDMAKELYKTHNGVYNFYVTDLGDYLLTGDLGDLVTMMHHPEIKEAKRLVMEEGMEMSDGYDRIIDVMRGDDPALRHNAIGMLARAGLVNLSQIVQLVSMRGRVYSTSGRIYDEPIYESYGGGIKTLAASAMETRQAAFALYMNTEPLQQTEYLNRRMQLHCEIIDRVEGHDCGTTHYADWLMGDHELHQFSGKYHFYDGELRVIRKTDTHLIGKRLKIRTFAHCENHDPTTVCATCLGETSLIMPENTNLGHFLTVYALSLMSQLILSTKHVVASQESLFLDLIDSVNDILKLNPKNKSEVMVKGAGIQRFVIRIKTDEFHGRNRVVNSNVPARNQLASRLSNISQLMIAGADEDGNRFGDWAVIDTSLGGDGSSLSLDVLEVVQDNGWKEVDEYMDVFLDDFKGKSIFVTPKRNESVIDYVNRARHFLFASQSEKSTTGDVITNHHTATEAMAALKDLFDKRMPKANFTTVEIFIRASMTVNGLQDVRLPVGGRTFIPLDARQIIQRRTVSAALAYERQRGPLLEPSAVLNTNRQNHPMDRISG